MNSKKTSTIQRKTSFMVSAYFVFDSFSCDTFNLGCKKAGDLSDLLLSKAVKI